jgi:hypothetical protein
MGGDGADDINRMDPGLGTDRGRETNPKWMGEIVSTSVFERHDNCPKDTVVLPPNHRCPLWRGRLNAPQTFL